MTKYALDKDSIPYSPRFGFVFGPCGALLIQQVHYWCSVNKEKGQNFYNGEFWCYNTYKQWEEQLAYFDYSTIRRTISSLTVLGVLVIGCYNKKSYDKTKWYRLNYEKLHQIVAAKIAEKVTEQPEPLLTMSTPTAHHGHIHLLTMGGPIPETKAETTEEIKTASQEQSPEEEDMKGKNGLTAAQIKEMCGKKPADTSKLTSTGMYHIWAKTVPEYNESVKFVGTFTAKQKGQVGALVGKWGKEAGVVLEFILMNWVKYGKHVKEQAGLKTYPAAPTIDFLLKYANDAMSFYIARSKEEAKDESVQLTAPKPMKKLVFGKLKQAPQAEKQAAPVVEVGSEDDDKPVTLEELLAMGKVYE